MYRVINFCSFILLTSLLFFSRPAAAQSWDIGGFVGGAGYMGDLNPVKVYKINNLAFGGQIKRSFDPYWSLKLAFTHGKIEADDARSDNEHFRERNINFFTPLTEVSLQTEFNFFSYVPSQSKKLYTPFLFAGIGLVGFNPKARYNDEVYELRQYGTEGQSLSVPYRNYAVTIPFGAGFKYNISGKWTLIAEAGYRTAFTDYLDDVSQRYPYRQQLEASGNAAFVDLRKHLADPSVSGIGLQGTQRGDYRKRDTYMFVGLSLTFSIFRNGCPVVAY